MTLTENKNSMWKRHPASEQWRNLDGFEYADLVQSIRDSGCHSESHADGDGRIFDGWHRYLACADAGVEPKIRTHERITDTEIARWVVGAHKGRRHLSKMEIAESAVRTLRACGEDFAGEEDKGGITRAAVAEDAGVSPSTAGRAIRTVKREEGRASVASPASDATEPSDDVEEEGGGTILVPPPQEDGPDEGADLEVALNRLAERDERIVLLEARIARLEGNLDPASREVLDEISNRTAQIRTLKSQVMEWQSKCRDANRKIKALQKRLRTAEGQRGGR